MWESSDNFFYQVPTYTQTNNQGASPDTDIGKLITDDAVKQRDGLLMQLMGIFNLDTPDYEGPQKAIYYIRKLINYALTFVSMIAFGLLLYAFYMMLIGDGDKGRAQVKSTLKGVAIAIAVMATSWLIVSMIFWTYDQQKPTATNAYHQIGMLA